MSKLDTMISKTISNEMIYLKILSKVYNLKDKLEYSECSAQIESEIKAAKCIVIEKINLEGKWKKITVEFGPYKARTEYDIVFQYNVQSGASVHLANNSNDNQIKIKNST